MLKLALPALDDSPYKDDWTLGGGTGLAVHYNHRISYDIDLFFPAMAALAYFSPVRNSRTRALSDRWQDPGHYIKIERPEGEIDFLATRPITGRAPSSVPFDGRTVRVDDPAEIVARKIYFRASTFKARDVFDFAELIRRNPDRIDEVLAATAQHHDRLRDRISKLSTEFEKVAASEINPMPDHRDLLVESPRIVAEALRLRPPA